MVVVQDAEANEDAGRIRHTSVFWLLPELSLFLKTAVATHLVRSFAQTLMAHYCRAANEQALHRVRHPHPTAREEKISRRCASQVCVTTTGANGSDGESNMTIATAIAALEALTADALLSADDAQLARLEELSGELEALIYDERERRNPTDTGLEA